MDKTTILNHLANVKNTYAQEGIIIQALFGSYARGQADTQSDIDILIEATPQFAQRYGFGAFGRLREIQDELSRAPGGIPVDLAGCTGMAKPPKSLFWIAPSMSKEPVR